jgi:hypothetical protein
LTPQYEADVSVAVMENVCRPDKRGVLITLDDHAVAPATPAGGAQNAGSPFWVIDAPLTVTAGAVEPGVNQTIAHTSTPHVLEPVEKY